MHGKKKLTCLLFNFGIVNTTDDNCDQQVLTVALYLQRVTTSTT